MFRVPKQSMPSTTTSASQTMPLKRSKEKINCSYALYDCNHQCLDGYSYCLKHILEDPSAPYKQCSFIYNHNGRKCNNPTLKLDRRDVSYCQEHTRKAQIARIKSSSRRSLPENSETLLLSLKHYVKPDDSNTNSNQENNKKMDALDPFVDVDATKVNAQMTNILDYASSSDSDVEPTLLCDTYRGNYYDDSDNESVPSAEEDPLRHAGIYTAEEIVSISRDKILKLQSLYIGQFRKLQYSLREKRRKYLHALKKEKETLCSVHDQIKQSAKEKKIYAKLKAMNNYHKRNGVEAILYKKWLDRRAQATDGPAQKPPSIPKCIFTEGGVKCGERTIPSSKYCRKHILKDSHQVLFRACGAKEGDTECHEPVPVIFDTNCIFHMNLPPVTQLKPMEFVEEKINVENSKDDNIDPDDDIAGIMREMNDEANKTSNFNDSVNSEASTDTAFSLTAQLSDRDDLLSM